jgi:hypothetical protein
MSIFKNKKTHLFYVLIHDNGNGTAKFIQINDHYEYTIPFNDMELWLFVQTVNGKTDKFNSMITAFQADFGLALVGDNKLQELQRLIDKKDRRLLEDIDLLQDLEMGLRYGRIEIHEIEGRENE